MQPFWLKFRLATRKHLIFFLPFWEQKKNSSTEELKKAKGQTSETLNKKAIKVETFSHSILQKEEEIVKSSSEIWRNPITAHSCPNKIAHPNFLLSRTKCLRRDLQVFVMIFIGRGINFNQNFCKAKSLIFLVNHTTWWPKFHNTGKTLDTLTSVRLTLTREKFQTSISLINRAFLWRKVKNKQVSTNCRDSVRKLPEAKFLLLLSNCLENEFRLALDSFRLTTVNICLIT